MLRIVQRKTEKGNPAGAGIQSPSAADDEDQLIGNAASARCDYD
jgi:hypothetical protein